MFAAILIIKGRGASPYRIVRGILSDCFASRALIDLSSMEDNRKFDQEDKVTQQTKFAPFLFCRFSPRNSNRVAGFLCLWAEYQLPAKAR